MTSNKCLVFCCCYFWCLIELPYWFKTGLCVNDLTILLDFFCFLFNFILLREEASESYIIDLNPVFCEAFSGFHVSVRQLNGSIHH